MVSAVIVGCNSFEPSTPKSDQFQISPAASREFFHHTVWKTFVRLDSDERWLYYQFSLPQFLIYLQKDWNVLFELGSERIIIVPFVRRYEKIAVLRLLRYMSRILLPHVPQCMIFPLNKISYGYEVKLEYSSDLRRGAKAGGEWRHVRWQVWKSQPCPS